MAWMTIKDFVVVNLDEVVLVTQGPGSPEKKGVRPVITTVHLRGGSTFELRGGTSIAFKKYFLEHVAKGATALEQVASADSVDLIQPEP
jgi:hypothetical protein